jgi:putative ABC transport system substrate-binding protein
MRSRLFPFRTGSRHSAKGCLRLATSKERNIIIESRYAEGKLDRLPALAAELVRVKVEVIVTSGAIPTRHTQEATATIPIVIAQDNDPVGNGFVASLARPGGNITGLSTLALELSGKRLEILKEIVPKLYRWPFLGRQTTPVTNRLCKKWNSPPARSRCSCNT